MACVEYNMANIVHVGIGIRADPRMLQPVDLYRVLFSSIHVSDGQSAAFNSRYPS